MCSLDFVAAFTAHLEASTYHKYDGGLGTEGNQHRLCISGPSRAGFYDGIIIHKLKERIMYIYTPHFLFYMYNCPTLLTLKPRGIHPRTQGRASFP